MKYQHGFLGQRREERKISSQLYVVCSVLQICVRAGDRLGGPLRTF